mgnify:CR=1 FL=1
MGNQNSGRKPISEQSHLIKQKLAEIARQGVVYLGQVADGEIKRPSGSRVAVITSAIDHTIGRAKQSVDTNISGSLTVIDQLRALSDADLARLAEMVKGGKNAQ